MSIKETTANSFSSNNQMGQWLPRYWRSEMPSGKTLWTECPGAPGLLSGHPADDDSDPRSRQAGHTYLMQGFRQKKIYGGGGGGGGHRFAKKGDLSSEHFLEGLH